MKQRKTNKRAHERAVRINITLPPSLCGAAEDVVRRFGFNGFSDYVQARIRKDAGLELAA